MLTDAVCGRSRRKNADENSVWAIIIEGLHQNQENFFMDIENSCPIGLYNYN